MQGEDPIAGGARLTAPRPDVLALPSAFASRAIALTVALLAVAGFVGAAVHNFSSVGDAWYATVRRCAATGDYRFSTTRQSYAQCVGHAQTVFVEFQVVAMVIVLAGLAAVAAALPIRIVRARRLTQPSTGLAAATARCAQLAQETGLRRPPRIWIGAANQRDAFAFGFPGRYAIALPKALAVRSGRASLFDPVVRHELQHVKRNDVAFAWVATAVRWILPPLLVIPIVLEIVVGDSSILGAYVWRAAVLGLTAYLAAAGLLRYREFEADLASARTTGQVTDLIALLGSTPAPKPRLGPLALHPGRSHRQEVLAEPVRATRVGFLDGLLAGLLAASAVPIVVGMFSNTTGAATYAPLAAALLGGAVLGTTVGPAICRDVLARQVAGLPTRRCATLYMGVFAGYTAGETSSLPRIGETTMFSFDRSTFFLPLAAVAATAICVGCARLLTCAAARLGRRPAGIVGVVLCGAVFTTTFWVALLLKVFVQSGAQGTRVALVTSFGTTGHEVVAGICAALCLGLLAAGRSNRALPGWAEQWPSTRPLAALPSVRLTAVAGTSVAAALGGAAVFVVRHVVAGGPTDAAHAIQLADVYTWMFALVAAAVTIGLLAQFGLSGLGASLFAAPLATTITVIFFVLYNATNGGAITWRFTRSLLMTGLGLEVVLITILSVVVAIVETLLGLRTDTVHRESVRLRGPAFAAAGASLLCAASLAALALGMREQISPLGADRLVASNDPSSAVAIDAATYRNQVAAKVELALSNAAQYSRTLSTKATVPNPLLMREMRSHVVAPMSQLARAVPRWSAQPAPIGPLNRILVAGVRQRLAAYQHIADFYGSGDLAAEQQAIGELQRSQVTLNRWEAGMAQLH
jgi:Zn-dependent protease with chaperone function